jgi:dihydropteroate synthase
MNRKIYYWKLRGSEMQLGERTLIMGVLNITPDSFSDGGLFNDPDRAYARALELEEQGADIIDIGAESTRPGSHRITADEEWQRLVPVLKRLKGNLRAPLSLDTYKSEIAERALQYGVEIFNDPSGLTFDPDMAKVASQNDAGLILNHMRGQPETWARLSPMKDAIETIAKDLDATISRARHAGVDRGRIVIDPGLGFGKRKEQNAEILAHLRKLAELDYPILVGPSRKSFLAQPSENETLYATAAAVTACVLNGAHIVRVHDVREMHAAVQVAEEIAKAAVAVPRVEERPAAVRPPRPQRSQSGPEFTAERPRPPRPPLSRPALPNPALPKPQEEVPPRREFRPAAPPRDRRDDRRDDRRPAPKGFRGPERRDDRPPRGFAPPRKTGGRPGGDNRPPKRPFRKRP